MEGTTSVKSFWFFVFLHFTCSIPYVIPVFICLCVIALPCGRVLDWYPLTVCFEWKASMRSILNLQRFCPVNISISHISQEIYHWIKVLVTICFLLSLFHWWGCVISPCVCLFPRSLKPALPRSPPTSSSLLWFALWRCIISVRLLCGLAPSADSKWPHRVWIIV